MRAGAASPAPEALATGAQRQANTSLGTVILTVLGLIAVFNIVRFFIETPEQRKARRERRNRHNSGGGLSCGGSACGASDGGSGDGGGGGGCGGGCGS